MQQSRTLDAIGWRRPEWFEQLRDSISPLDLAFSLALNHYQNQTTMQLELLDIISRSAPPSMTLAWFHILGQAPSSRSSQFSTPFIPCFALHLWLRFGFPI